MVVVPAATPVTTPLLEPIVATVVVLLAQAPPPPSLKAVVELTHTARVPDIAEGSGLTVNTIVVVQPVANV